MGADGTVLSSFSATSTGGVSVSGSFAGGSGLVAIQCPASPSCSWTGGFAADYHLVWAFNNSTSSGTGPLTLALGKAVLAGGLEIQSDAVDAFTAQVQAFNGATLLGTESLTSDAAGDPVFIGAQDTTADITSVVFDLTACTGVGCSVNDFAVDSLSTINPAVVGVAAPLLGLPTFLAVFFGTSLARRIRPSRKSVA